MSTQKTTIEVVPYNSIWPHQFEEEARIIKQALGKNCIEVHHIGSTSIPNLTAKSDIDILCIVNKLSDSLSLQDFSYIYKGELNIPLRCFFSKNTPKKKVNLHVVELGHGFISMNLCFRDYLRAHKAARLAYANLKIELLKDPKSHQKIDGKFCVYTLRKSSFIKGILKEAKFNDFCLNFCMLDEEWKAYHRIREEQIFNPINIVYDRNHPTISDSSHFHFVLYKGTTIVTTAHIELLNNKEVIIRSLATDEPYKRQGYGRQMVKLLEKWIINQKRKTIKVHSNLRAELFYRKLGYTDMIFNDKSISKETVDLGKHLSD
jgi:GrpB-like predicted nucleotidyltransferase (UPF0157 family)/GNAT superfamily N-acetyltransferase